MSQWTDRVAPEAAQRLADNANDGAQFLSQQIQDMQQSGHGREALELVRRTQQIESRYQQISPYGGLIETNHQLARNGWIYENVAVNGQQIAAIPERPRDCPEGQPFREGIHVPEIALGVGIGLLARKLLQGNGHGNYYEHRESQRHNFRPHWPY